MQAKPRRLIFLLCLEFFAAVCDVRAVDPPAEAADKPGEAADSSTEARQVPPVPAEGDADAFRDYLDELKFFRPEPEQVVPLLTNAKQAADKLMTLIEDKESDEYREAKIISLSVGAQLIGTYKPAEQRKAYEQYRSYFADKDALTREDLSLAAMVARRLEQQEDVTLAKQAYREFGRIFENAGGPVARFAETFEASARRLDLLGNEMRVSGKTMAGKPFKLSDLKGKVVLVDFWATWCGPCIAEYPNMLKNYERFHDQGFEIVGVSLDEDRDAVENFVERKEVPWTILHDKEHPGESEAASEYGISAIPAMFLVNREGKVVSLHARGEELTAQLEKLFGKSEASDK